MFLYLLHLIVIIKKYIRLLEGFYLNIAYINY